jgi:hypothetical protein
VLTFSFILVSSLHTGHPIKVVIGILTGPADEEILLLVDKVPTCVFALLKVGNELDGVGRTGLLTHSTIDAPRKVDPEKFRIAAFMSLWIVRGLKCDTIDGTSRRAQVARDTAFLSVGISGQDDSSAPAWR